MNFTAIMNQPIAASELIIGHNYADVFGLDKEKKAMIYNGGISWTAKDSDREMTTDCQKTTDSVLKYINKNVKS
jgi:hypothetical protein